VRSFFVVLVLFLTLPVFAQRKVVGYVSNADTVEVDYSRITHLNLAFINPTDASGTLNFTSWDFTTLPLKTKYVVDAHARGVKVLASMAGGSASENTVMRSRYFSLISDANRKMFIQKILAFVKANNLDGIDVDLEGPMINGDYGKFIDDLCAALHPHGKLVTAALSHMNGADRVPSSAMQQFDYVNIMAYDKTGFWNPAVPGQHASVDFAIESLNYWVGRGLAKTKCILGVPFYGHSFGVANTTYSYSQIVNTFSGAENVDQVTIDGSTIYYNGIPTIKRKVQLVIDGNYGGIMIWNLGQDKESGDAKSLLRVIGW
jgi:GH18 family chitinase